MGEVRQPQYAMPVRVVTWNVNARRDVAAQVAAVLALDADLVTLQEITYTTSRGWCSALRAAGYDVASSFDHLPEPYPLGGPRRYGEIVACRGKIMGSGLRGHPWPERVLFADCRIQGQVVKLWTFHVPPGSSNGWVKVECLEGFCERSAIVPLGYRIVTGDFNTPREELPSGEIVTWGQRKAADGTWKVRRGMERWDAAERHVLTGLGAGFLRDAFRSLHGYGREEFS